MATIEIPDSAIPAHLELTGEVQIGSLYGGVNEAMGLHVYVGARHKKQAADYLTEAHKLLNRMPQSLYRVLKANRPSTTQKTVAWLAEEMAKEDK